MGAGQRNKRSKVVPECQQALDQWKYEIAAELGLAVGNGRQGSGYGFDAEFGEEITAAPENSSGNEDYWGYLTARDTGAVGGEITRRLIRQGQLQEMNNQGLQ